MISFQNLYKLGHKLNTFDISSIVLTGVRFKPGIYLKCSECGHIFYLLNKANCDTDIWFCASNDMLDGWDLYNRGKPPTCDELVIKEIIK